MILSDKLRDEVLPHLGIRLEDRGKGVESIWKFEDKDVLLKEIQDKIAEKQRKEEEKRARKELELKKVNLCLLTIHRNRLLHLNGSRLSSPKITLSMIVKACL